MNDDELRDRLAATDPMHEGVPTDPIHSARAQSLLESIVNTTIDQNEPTGQPEPTPLEPRRSRPKWMAPVLAVAAVAVLAVGGAAVGGVFSDDGESEPEQAATTEPAPTVMELSTGDVDPTLMSCMALDPTILAQSPVAFRATVDSVEGEQVTLTVDTWYAGGDADVVELTAPAGMEALIGGLSFVPGDTYLVSAYDGVVSYCGATGPATPELQAMYDAAFPA